MGSCRHQSHFRIVKAFLYKGNCLFMQMKANFTGFRHFQAMSQKPESGNVRTGMNGKMIHDLLRLSVQTHHNRSRLFHSPFRCKRNLGCSINNPCSNLLCQNQNISRLCSVVFLHFSGMYQAGNTESVKRLIILNGMPANKDSSGFLHLIRASFHNFRKHIRR